MAIISTASSNEDITPLDKGEGSLDIFDNSVYKQHGYADRAEYLAELSDEYGAELVDALTSMLPESEDFDGLVIELQDNAGLFD